MSEKKTTETTVKDTGHFQIKAHIVEVTPEKNGTRLLMELLDTKKPKAAIVDWDYLILRKYKGLSVLIEGRNDLRKNVWVLENVEWLVNKGKLDEHFSPIEREAAAAALNILSFEQNAAVWRRLEQNPPSVYAEENDEVSFNSFLELKNLYTVIKRLIPANVQTEIESAISLYSASSSSDKLVYTRLLRILVNEIKWEAPAPKLPSDEEILMAMDETHYGRKREKQLLIQTLKNRENTTSSPLCILFCGTSGSGKTSLIHSFLQAANLKAPTIAVNGKTDEVSITGSSRIYENGKPGRIIRSIVQNSLHSAIVLEEVDKAGEKIASSLLDVLSGNFIDEFLEIPVDLSSVLFLATCNSLNDVPPALLDRMTVIEIPDYTDKEKIAIAEQFILPSIFGTHRAKLSFSKEALHRLIIDDTLTGSVREIRENLNHVFDLADQRGVKQQKIDLRKLPDYTVEIVGTGDARIAATRKEQLRRKFLYYRKAYTPEMQARILELFQMLNAADSNDSAKPQDKAYALNALKKLVNLVPGNSDFANPDIDLNTLRKELSASHYGLKQAKFEILKYFAGNRLKEDDGYMRPILLDGPAGIGKTTLAKSIAAALGRPFVKISLDGISTPNTLTGSPRNYSGAEASIFAETLSKPGVCTCLAVILLDELDKLNFGGGKDSYNALHSIFDKTGGLYDQYLNVHLPLDHALIIATSNDMQKIPSTILDRMKCFHLAGYTAEEKAVIAKDYVIPKLMKQYHLRGKFPVAMIETVVAHCPAPGIRDLERAFVDIIETAAIQQDLTKNQELCLSQNQLTEFFKDCDPMVPSVSLSSSTVGLAQALGIRMDCASLFQVEVMPNPYGIEPVKVTGLLKDSMRESVEVAITVAQNLLKKDLGKIHLHIAAGGIPKDGPSAGMAVLAALLSYMEQKPLGNVVFTGELHLLGNIGKVGGILPKLNCAYSQKIPKILLPEANYLLLKEAGQLSRFKQMQIVPIRHARQLMNAIWGDTDTKYYELQKEATYEEPRKL